MFTKILIANRGEIACRVIKTARAMGIQTVAVYSSPDKDSMHVQLADTAYWIGEAASKDSYLNIANIIKAAKDSGAQAIHPGYGFLSENTHFAKACSDAGIVFIGPSIAAMEAMASKQVAKQLLEKTNVPLTPGYHGKEQTQAELLAAAKKIGFPVLLKAANGGGGKGMREVKSEDEFSDALASAKRESQASFADDTMIIEKLVQNPRHIEVQIMADNHGNVVHLFERDCSIQRRHQKIIEEAPAPNLEPQLRERITQAACEVARSIQYRGAGTVEFLLDGDQFYFMEMNTRLQVEHPITEMVTGLDLVAWQFKIASDETLPLQQKEIKCVGHAIECRIYAEDPYQGFIPSIGQLHFLKEPQGPGIRIDTGVRQNSTITMYYDPMIAKLIVYGVDRNEALRTMSYALTNYHIGGVKSNIPFLQAICQHPHFIQAKLSTNFLTKERIELESPNAQQAFLMAAAFDYVRSHNIHHDPLLQDTFSWQSASSTKWTWRYEHNEAIEELRILPQDKNHFSVLFNNQEYTICCSLREDQLTIELNQYTHKIIVEQHSDALIFYTSKGPICIKRFCWDNLNAQSHSNKGQLTAPMPATVVAVLKNQGDQVKAGDRLIVLEAMKMEHTIHAPIDGVLAEIFYAVGAQVNEGAELLSLK